MSGQPYLTCLTLDVFIDLLISGDLLSSQSFFTSGALRSCRSLLRSGHSFLTSGVLRYGHSLLISGGLRSGHSFLTSEVLHVSCSSGSPPLSSFLAFSFHSGCSGSRWIPHTQLRTGRITCTRKRNQKTRTICTVLPYIKID